MRCKSESAALGIIGMAFLATALHAQEAGPGSPWRGAGAKPCFGPDGGTFQCRAAPGVIALRAGRLFDSKSGQLLANQVVLLEGERITEVGAAAQIKIPADAQVIDLSEATVLPGLIDAHTHMFNYPKPGMSRETSTLIAIHNLQADLRAGFTAARDMSSHSNGYADVDVRNAINEGRLETVRDFRCRAGASSGPVPHRPQPRGTRWRACACTRRRKPGRPCASTSTAASIGSSSTPAAPTPSSGAARPNTS